MCKKIKKKVALQFPWDTDSEDEDSWMIDRGNHAMDVFQNVTNLWVEQFNEKMQQWTTMLIRKKNDIQHYAKRLDRSGSCPRYNQIRNLRMLKHMEWQLLRFYELRLEHESFMRRGSAKIILDAAHRVLHFREHTGADMFARNVPITSHEEKWVVRLYDWRTSFYQFTIPVQLSVEIFFTDKFYDLDGIICSLHDERVLERLNIVQDPDLCDF